MIRDTLKILPKGLDETYHKTLQRIRGQPEEHWKLAERVFDWITYALEPLSVDGLKHALATKPDTTLLSNDDLINQKFLLSVCAGLVVIDDESSIIRFVRRWSFFLIWSNLRISFFVDQPSFSI